jgi:hypothetical protein
LMSAVSLVAAFVEGLTPPPVQRMDLAARHAGVRLLPRVRSPRHARRGRGSHRRARPRHHLVGRGRQPGGLHPFPPRGRRGVHASGDLQRRQYRTRQRETFTGAVCFAIGGIIQAFDKPTPTRTVVQDTP